MTPEIDVAERLVTLISGQGGVIFLFVVFIVALTRKWIVLGWVYDLCAQDNTVCRKDLSDRAAKMEAKLERRDDEGRRG